MSAAVRLTCWLACLEAMVTVSEHANGEQDANGVIHMPDLGRRLTIGSLYDVRSDQVVAGFLWPLEVLRDRNYVVFIPSKFSSYEFAYGDSFQHKAQLTDLKGELMMSFMTGRVKVDGSARFLKDRRMTSSDVRMSTKYKVRTQTVTIDAFHGALKDKLHADVVANQRATHVVTSVTYGADCVATFEKTCSSIQERDLTKAYLRTQIDMGVWSADITADYHSDGQRRSIAEGIKVRLHGDVLPFGNESLPTEPAAALKFMQNLHIHGIADGGVPMDLILTPIAWFNDKAAQLKRRIASDKLDRALAIFMELDESEEQVNDLLQIPTDGFLSWGWTQLSYLANIIAYRENYTQHLADAIIQFRNGADTEMLTMLFQDYASGAFNSGNVSTYCEFQRNSIYNMKALVSVMKDDVGITVAEHFSDYMALTLDQRFHKVYALLIVGMNPDRDRASNEIIRRFTALARARRGGGGASSAEFCLEAEQDGATVCIERLAFVTVHVDTFCEQFCGPQSCSQLVTGCDDPDASGELFVSDRNQWCERPCTTVLEYANSRAPTGAARLLPRLPAKPEITSVTGAQDVEPSPHHQKVTLHITSGEVAIRNYRVRVIWFRSTSQRNRTVWQRQERVFDTLSADNIISVRQLVAGRRYTFAVAGINDVGEGPYSAEYRQGGKELQVAHNMATVLPHTAASASRPLQNKAPSWRALRITVVTSVDVDAPLGPVVFRHRDGLRTLECEDYGTPSRSNVNCTIPAQATNLAAHPSPETWDVVVQDVNGDEDIAWGAVTIEPPTARLCGRWEPNKPLLCDLRHLGRLDCVGNCGDCTVNDQQTNQFGSVCTLDVCPGDGMLWCPSDERGGTSSAGGGDEGHCIDESHEREHGCSAHCMEGSKFAHSDNGRPMCAVPCQLTLPDSVSQACTLIAPGSTCTVQCATGYSSIDSEEDFWCPSNNTVLRWGVSSLGFKILDSCVPQRCPGNKMVFGAAEIEFDALATGDVRELSCSQATPWTTGSVLLSCVGGVMHSVGTCKANSCMCEGGTPAVASACSIDGGNICATCDPGYWKDGDRCNAGLPAADHDSGWFPVGKNSNYDMIHGLGVLPALAVVWGASDCTGSNAYLMDGIYSSNGYGSWLQRITTTRYRVSTGPASAMSGYGQDNHWSWDDGTGCIRVLMWGGPGGLLQKAAHDSGWFGVGKNSNYDKTHTLGVLPALAIVWAASDCTGSHAYLMDGIYSSNGYGSWLQRITSTQYRVSTGPASAMSGYGQDNHWSWDDGTGCIRVLMWGGSQGARPAADHDSGWFNVVANTNYDRMHGFGALPALAVVWGASDCTGSNAYLMDGIYSSNGYGSWLQRITSTQYRVSTGPASAMSGYGQDNHWSWDDGTGCIRVLMWRSP